MQIWPAIDVRDGKCVRLSRGDHRTEAVYGYCPADMAIRWVAEGASGLHIVDIDATTNQDSKNFDSIVEIAEQVDIPLQIRGGIRDEDTILAYLEAGIKRVVLDPGENLQLEWLNEMFEKYPDHLVLALDAISTNESSEFHPSTTGAGLLEFALQMPVRPLGIVYTDILTEGKQERTNIGAIEAMQSTVNVPLIAAGGVNNVDDVANLAKLNVYGCIIGRALYEGRLILEDAIRVSTSGAAS